MFVRKSPDSFKNNVKKKHLIIKQCAEDEPDFTTIITLLLFLISTRPSIPYVKVLQHWVSHFISKGNPGANQDVGLLRSSAKKTRRGKNPIMDRTKMMGMA